MVLYFAYAFVLLFIRKLRQFIVYKHPVIIGICESLMITYGITVTGGESSYLYFSYIMVIIFYGIVHTVPELAIITTYVSASYFIISLIMYENITFACMFKVTYLMMIGVFIGLINGKIKTYNSDMALKDQLTGLYNRQYLFGEFENLILDNQKETKVFSILVIDLNDFKMINDTYGHVEGDRVLKEVASLLKKTLKPENTSARYGGDEFVVLLPDADTKAAEELKKILYDEMLRNFKGEVSFSIGVATFPEDGTDEEALFNAADRKMYEEKNRFKSLGC
jgi:diguanylate cyclase (GGDEF)-like protein